MVDTTAVRCVHDTLTHWFITVESVSCQLYRRFRLSVCLSHSRALISHCTISTWCLFKMADDMSLATLKINNTGKASYYSSHYVWFIIIFDFKWQPKSKGSKIKGPVAANSSSSTPTTTIPPTPVAIEIVAYSQQSRFHRETFDANSTDIDLKGVNVSVNNKELLVDAHLRLKSGVRYGMVGQNGVGKSGT